MSVYTGDNPKNVEIGIMDVDARHFLSQHVYFRRERLGLTQSQLAERMESTQAQVANIEAGDVNPTLHTLVKLAHALHCPGPHELLAPTDGAPDLEHDGWDKSEVSDFATWAEGAFENAPRVAPEGRGRFRLLTKDDDWLGAGETTADPALSA